jgi:aryl-alcohol dehydrogenase-like predicted oxidoreductase
VRIIDGRPDSLRKTCEEALKRLQTDVIDLYYLHRWDKKVPIEDSVGALSDLVRQGKIQTIGLSEVSASNLRKAHAVHPITAVQTEYSLWTRNPEIAVLEACKELGTAFVAFSPVARGFLCGELDLNAFDAKDIRKSMPRFTPENYAANLKLFAPYQKLAQEAGCSPAQLALAWLLHKDTHIIPIPGTTSVPHLRDDMSASNVKLSLDLIEKLDELVNEKTVHGSRYSAQSNSEVDTENFA